jgi:AraC-like DNA-binding protein
VLSRSLNPELAFPVPSSPARPHSTVSVHVLRGLVGASEGMGVPVTTLLQAAGLAPELLVGADGRVPLHDIYTVSELATELTGDPALGLHWVDRIDEGTLALLSPLLAHASTMRQAFAALARFYQLLCDHPHYEVSEQGDRVTLRMLDMAGASPRLLRFASEMIVGGFYRFIRHFKADARPLSLGFVYAAPAHRHAYAQFFDGVERFDQPFTGIVFDRALLDLPAPHQDEELHETLTSLAERRLLRVKNGKSYALRVRELVMGSGAPQRSDMETAARALGLSVRSLRRLLDAEGTSFSNILHETLVVTAKQLLDGGQRTIQETAHQMGFSGASAFHRAFRSWTGMTPAEYRKAPR